MTLHQLDADPLFVGSKTAAGVSVGDGVGNARETLA